jgi:hypothetical protein
MQIASLLQLLGNKRRDEQTCLEISETIYGNEWSRFIWENVTQRERLCSWGAFGELLQEADARAVLSLITAANKNK